MEEGNLIHIKFESLILIDLQSISKFHKIESHVTEEDKSIQSTWYMKAGFEPNFGFNLPEIM